MGRPKGSKVHADWARFAVDIKAARTDLKLLQRELAKELGCSIGTVSNLERQHSCNRKIMNIFCSELGLRAEDYLTGGENASN